MMRIAIVGAGISGLMAAYLLDRGGHQVTVYEAGPTLGGHSNTVDCDVEGVGLPVDTGFIVHNDRTYPHFLRLLAELGVETQATEMSFSVTSEATGLEYNGHSLSTLFAQRRNLVNPRFLGMIWDVLRLNREARALLTEAEPTPLTVGEFLERQRYGRMVRDLYLLPMGAAIWSSRVTDIADFPARAFFQFFENHGLLSVADRPEWRVIVGGSRSYVQAIVRKCKAHYRLNCPVRRVSRQSDSVTIDTVQGGAERYDHVVFASHSDQALGMLADPSPAERDILGAIPYQANEAVLHFDARVLPTSRRAWASWNCFLPASPGEPAAITYNQSILQNFVTQRPVCVTLNRTHAIDPALVVRRIQYHHPRYSEAAFAAQTRHGEISGVGRTHYCGAYWGWGFHEDGVVSAVRVARDLGVRW
jgi:uncharacterized protein